MQYRPTGPFSRRDFLRLGAASTLLAGPARAARKLPSAAGQMFDVDLVVYGGTSAGVVAAIQARRLGKRVALIEPGHHLGGMSAAGLSATDIGNRRALGGIAREFYRRVFDHYVRAYGADSQQVKDTHDGRSFEPHVAEKTFLDMVHEAGVSVFYRHELRSAVVQTGEIVKLVTEPETVFRAPMFIDASYEGDLMAAAGVSFVVGREANDQYRETLNGVQFGRPYHNFRVPVDPYVVEGKASSGLLKGVSAQEPGAQGAGDRKIQAYTFRLCLTRDPANRLPFLLPVSYDPDRYTLLARYVNAGVWDALRFTDALPNGKVDLNSNGAFSTDHVGGSYAWPEGDAATRRRVFQDHVAYQQGLLWFLGHDERVPVGIRQEVNQWGLAKDEFTETGGWPHQLYVREARRLRSDYVMTEHNCHGAARVEDPVGVASYQMDSHHCQRVAVDGRAVNEGDVQVGGFYPYPVSYRALVPRESECRNLLVPVCLCASHIAYGSIRMEPVLMTLAESAATAACLAMDAKLPVQQVDPSLLRDRLLAQGQVLDLNLRNEPLQALALDPRALKGIVVDDAEAQKVGAWNGVPLMNPRRVGAGYVHDNNADKGLLSIVYTPNLPADGSYDVVLIFPPNPVAATNVPVLITVEGVGSTLLHVDQTSDENNGFVSLGTFKLPKGRSASVTLLNQGTDGYVVADAVQFIPFS